MSLGEAQGDALDWVIIDKANNIIKIEATRDIFLIYNLKTIDIGIRASMDKEPNWREF